MEQHIDKYCNIKTLMLGGIGGRRRRGWPRMRWLDSITDSMDVRLTEFRSWWWTGRPGMLRFMGLQRVGHDWATELNWTEHEWTKMLQLLKKTIIDKDHIWYNLCIVSLISKSAEINGCHELGWEEYQVWRLEYGVSFHSNENTLKSAMMLVQFNILKPKALYTLKG